MKTITLEEAFAIIEKASAIIADDVLIYPALEGLTGDDDNEFMCIYWNEDGEDYSLSFTEGRNRQVTVSGSSLYLYDIDADDETCHTQLTILVPENLE